MRGLLPDLPQSCTTCYQRNFEAIAPPSPAIRHRPDLRRDRPDENQELVPTVPRHRPYETLESVPTVQGDHADGADHPPTIGTVPMVPGAVPMRSVRDSASVPMIPTKPTIPTPRPDGRHRPDGPDENGLVLPMWSRPGACGADAVPKKAIYNPQADASGRW